MALVAAFVMSAYAASAHRAASKPFNPLLGETYECVREDRGFHFVAEQVGTVLMQQCTPHRTHGTGGSLRRERVRGVRAPRRLQAVQPAARRDLRVRA
ncbi:unnamed protein product [Parnassius apollo]|uniref:(apollo) hypothetical protein n=1 Tax=Parnassius apollo TaxID=110799 RepID=A0A8S3WYF3_PARAO|nr:unnamed protein product [Parnassius apollo]